MNDLLRAVFRAIDDAKADYPPTPRTSHGEAVTDVLILDRDAHSGNVAQYRLAKTFMTGGAIWSVRYQMFLPSDTTETAIGDVIIHKGRAFTYQGRAGWELETDMQKLLTETVKGYPNHDHA